MRGQEMVEGAEVMAPMVDSALSWVAGNVPSARDVLDIGSGPGVAACRFAQLLADARVLAVDGAGPLLDLADERAAALGVHDRVSTRLTPLPEGLSDLEPADLIWVSGVVHHLPDPLAAVRSLGSLLRPGGLLALREGGLPMRFLPDSAAPGLLPRLEAISDDLVAAGEHPGGIAPHEGGWPDLLSQAGLSPAGSRSFLLDLPAPLSPAARRMLHHRLTMQRTFAAGHITAKDEHSLDRLLDEDSPEGLLHRPDVFVLGVSTIHIGRT